MNPIKALYRRLQMKCDNCDDLGDRITELCKGFDSRIKKLEDTWPNPVGELWSRDLVIEKLIKDIRMCRQKNAALTADMTDYRSSQEHTREANKRISAYKDELLGEKAKYLRIVKSTQECFDTEVAKHKKHIANLQACNTELNAYADKQTNDLKELREAASAALSFKFVMTESEHALSRLV